MSDPGKFIILVIVPLSIMLGVFIPQQLKRERKKKSHDKKNKKEDIITSNNTESFGVMYMVLAALVGVGYGVISDDLTTGLVSGMVIGLAIDLLVYFKNKR